MGLTPVRTLNPIKRDGIGGVANDPVIFWILRKGVTDSILGKRLTFLVEEFQSKCSTRNSTSLLLTLSSSEISAKMTTTSMMSSVTMTAEIITTGP